MKKFLSIFAGLAALACASGAGATTLVFKGDGNNVTPTGTAGVDYQENCASTGDFCSIDHSAGLSYSYLGVDLTVVAYADDVATRLIQDIRPGDSGLGAFSENNSSDDQTQYDSGEAIEFIFTKEYEITNVEFNAGDDDDCTNSSGGGGEGSCGEFLLEVFNLADVMVASMVVDITNVDVLASLGAGARFVLTALTEGSGFVVAQFTVNEVPVPGALILMLSGLAGFRLATRKAKRD